MLFRNPLRKDNNPSCGFYYSKNDTLFFHDFATGVHYSWASIVRCKYNLTYAHALEKIREDRNLIKAVNVSKLEEEDVELDVVVSEKLHPYFSLFGITPETLKKFNVHGVQSVYRNKKIQFRATTDNPIFAYYFPSGRIKLYRPLSPDKTKK